MDRERMEVLRQLAESRRQAMAEVEHAIRAVSGSSEARDVADMRAATADVKAATQRLRAIIEKQGELLRRLDG